MSETETPVAPTTEPPETQEEESTESAPEETPEPTEQPSDPNTGEADFSAGATAQARDNSEQEAAAPQTASQGEVDFTAPGGVHAPTGHDAAVQEARQKVEALFAEFSNAVSDFLSAVKDATGSAPAPTEETTPSDAQ